MQWDTAYWSERLREAKYELKEEDLRPYFQLPAVIDGTGSHIRCLFLFLMIFVGHGILTESA